MIHPEIASALANLPSALLRRSGKIFYTGAQAFHGHCPLYLLGINPGGDPELEQAETVGLDVLGRADRPELWSAFVHETDWGNKNGQAPLQRRVLHLLDGLQLDPLLTPASNAVFVRSRAEADLKREMPDLLATCWPVHQAVISSLGVRVVACFGKTAGWWVRQQLGANELLETFTETHSKRSWTSQLHRANDGRIVATLTHPGRADWTCRHSDPTILVRHGLDLALR